MQDDAFIVVFPSEFARTKMARLVENIKKELVFKEQKFRSIKKEDGVIVVQANDPVFASAVINRLFGIEKIAIARRTLNDLKSIVSETTKIGGNLLLRGETFLVRIEGNVKGFVPKDAEMAATSSIIEKKARSSATPGSENKHDKLLYTYVTKKSAYVCIFTDQGHGGVPNLSQNQEIVCPIFDEISAISCIETARQGFTVRIIIAYRKKSELVRLAKLLTKVITYTLQRDIDLGFYHIEQASNQYDFLNSVVHLCRTVAKDSKIKRVSLPVSSQMLPIEFTDRISDFLHESGIIVHLPIEGSEDNIRSRARKYVLEKYLAKITIHRNSEFSGIRQARFKANAARAAHNKQVITVRIGPNNLHDILDSLGNN